MVLFLCMDYYAIFCIDCHTSAFVGVLLNIQLLKSAFQIAKYLNLNISNCTSTSTKLLPNDPPPTYIFHTTKQYQPVTSLIHIRCHDLIEFKLKIILIFMQFSGRCIYIKIHHKKSQNDKNFLALIRYCILLA